MTRGGPVPGPAEYSENMLHERRRPLLLQPPCFDSDVFADDEPVSGHLLELWEHTINMIGCIDEGQNQGKLATGIHQGCGLYPAPTGEACDSMNDGSSGNILFAEKLEKLQVQRFAMPLISFIEIHRDLDSGAGLVHLS